MGLNLTNQQIQNTFQNLIQVSGSVYTDGLGNEVELTVNAYTEAESDARFLGITAKANDSNALDGIDSSAFLRSNTSDTHTAGIFTFNTRPVFGSSGAPMTVSSTTAVSNLNADLLDGQHGSAFVRNNITTGVSFNGSYLQFSGDGGSNNDYIGFNDSTNTFVFSSDTTRQLSTGNATLVAGVFNEGGTNLSSKYLGINNKAADSNLLDGINSTQFLRSDQNDTTSGELTAASFKTGLWVIDVSGTSLIFKYDGDTKFTLTNTGDLTVEGNVTAG